MRKAGNFQLNSILSGFPEILELLKFGRICLAILSLLKQPTDMRPNIFTILLALMIPAGVLFSQNEPNFKFGKVSETDFTLKSPVIDSNTNAVVISDVGTSKIEGNNKGWFSLIHKRTTRIKVLNKKGFDAGTISIPLYKSNDGEEKVSEIKAVTYNLENGAIQQTKLESPNIFKEITGKNTVSKKFTFPNLKEGSIIEYTYTIESEFIQFLREWEFQGEYPRLFTQYTVYIPEFFQYVFLSQGYVPLTSKKKDVFKTYSVSESKGTQATERYSLNGYETQSTWSSTNVPALKEEPYTSSINNHISKINFQLSRIQFGTNPPKDVMGNWAKASEELLKSEYFGNEITRPNNWLSDDVKKITEGATTNIDAAKAIYAYVRDHFTKTQNVGMFMSENTTLKEVFKKKSGTLPELNLLLIAMLRQQGIAADPVLLSTRSNGWANPSYPLITKYNYVICRTKLNGREYLLDAGQPRLGFGKLPMYCYNGFAFVVSVSPQNITILPDSLKETKSTLVFITNKEDGKSMTANFKSTPGYYESTAIREKIAAKDEDDYFKDIAKGYTLPVKLSDKKVNALENFEDPVSVSYKMDMNLGDEDIIYLNPMFSEATKNNPFTSAERQYPVEMPCTVSEIYVLNMEVPKGYKVDELPKSTRVSLNDDEGMFEYIIHEKEGRIMLQSRINIQKTDFSAEDYKTLRDFFGHIVKKQNEPIVLKKIK